MENVPPPADTAEQASAWRKSVDSSSGDAPISLGVARSNSFGLVIGAEEEGESDSSDAYSAAPPPSLQIKPKEVIRSTPKLGKLLGDDGPKPSAANTGGGGAQRLRSMSGSGDKIPKPGARVEPSDRDEGCGSLSKVSKFFGTVISKDTATALQSKSRTLRVPVVGFGSDDVAQGAAAASPVSPRAPSLQLMGSPVAGTSAGSLAKGQSVSASVSPVGPRIGSSSLEQSPAPQRLDVVQEDVLVPAAKPVTRTHRRASSACQLLYTSHEDFSAVEAVRKAPASKNVSPPPLQGMVAGRLMMTLFKPSGISNKERCYFEVTVEATVVYQSPYLERKAPEWRCNVFPMTSVDSMLSVKLYRGKGDVFETCHINLKGATLGEVRAKSLEFSNGARQQVVLTPMDFGMIPADVQEAPTEEVVLDSPNVLDVVVDGLFDIRLEKKQVSAPLVLQITYADQCMRSDRMSSWNPDTASWEDFQVDATFRLLPSSRHFMIKLIQGDAYPGEELARKKITFKDVFNNACSRNRGHFFTLRDPSTNTARGFVHVKFSWARPNAGMLAHLGVPLLGIPLRLDWGDIVCFSLKSISAQLVSAATSSSWDHCGIVFEEDGKQFLLEALQTGVQALPLNARLLDSLHQGARLGFRRVSVTRTPEMKAELWSFAIGMTGRSYKKSVSQLVGSRWGRNKQDDLSSVFCSELVAAALKHIELLDESTVVSNVLPKDIASNEFVLKKGALLPLVFYNFKLHNMASTLAKATEESSE